MPGSRAQAIEEAVIRLLAGYRQPAGFEAGQGAAFLARLVAELDVRLPSSSLGDLAATAERVCAAVARRHDGHDWPALPAFLKAVEEALPGPGAGRVETFRPRDTVAMFARRVASGHPVPETFVTGRGGAEAVARGLITAEQLSAYRHGREARA